MGPRRGAGLRGSALRSGILSGLPWRCGCCVRLGKLTPHAVPMELLGRTCFSAFKLQTMSSNSWDP